MVRFEELGEVLTLNIAYFSPIPFDFLMQRPQYLAIELSKKHNVCFIEPTLSTIRWVSGRNRSPIYSNRVYNDTLNIISLNGLFAAPWIINPYDFTGIGTAWERIQFKRFMPHVDIAWVGHCGWYPLVQRLKYRHLVYDKMDDNALIARCKLRANQLVKSDKKLLHKADCIFATSKYLFEDALNINRNTFRIPNAVNSNFADFYVTNKEGTKKKVFGYIGMIDDWFDIDAILTIARASESHEVILVGPSNIPKIEHEQIKYVGRVPKEKLSELIKCFNVCLYPFKNNQLTKTINPVKIYEYLAMNKPILAIKSLEITTFGDLINCYVNLEDLSRLSLTNQPLPFKTEEDMQNFVSENSWERRGEQVSRILEDLQTQIYKIFL